MYELYAGLLPKELYVSIVHLSLGVFILTFAERPHHNRGPPSRFAPPIPVRVRCTPLHCTLRFSVAALSASRHATSFTKAQEKLVVYLAKLQKMNLRLLFSLTSQLFLSKWPYSADL